MPAVLSLVAAFLGIVWTAVFVLGDTHVLVSPPESVAVEFLRSLRTRRYEQGRNHLASALRARTSAHDLRELSEALEARLGRIEKVSGEKGAAPDEADGIVTTSQGPRRVRLPFQREKGQWYVRDLAPLVALR